MEKSKILIVEDEAIIAMEIELSLKKLGYQVLAIVDTGEAAIEKAEILNPDIILMDIRLKGAIDGIKAASQIRSESNIPIIFLTAYAEDDKLERAKLILPFGYLLKPIQDRDLKVTIEMALYASDIDAGRKKAERELKKLKDDLEVQVHQRTKELENNRIRLELALDGADIGLWDWNIQTGKIDFSKRWAENLGYQLEEIECHVNTWEKLLHPEDKKRALMVMKANLEDKIPFYESEHRLKTKSGSWKWVLARGRVVERDQKGQALRHAGTQIDITERTIALQKVKKAKEVAESANRTKSEFLSNISHEIRTPMHQILSYSQFGVRKIDKVDKEKLLHYFAKIGDIGNNVLALLNDLLDLSKIESGKLEYDMLKQDLKSIIHNVSTEFVSLMNEKNLFLESIDNSLPTQVVCDEQKISQVIRNLLSNAIKFTEKGKKISISFELGKNTNVQAESKSNHHSVLIVKVKDQGPGIPKNELASIFDKFVQSSKTKSNLGGTGLGLAISQEIIKAHQGKIWVENNSNGGSTFSFILPYEQSMELL